MLEEQLRSAAARGNLEELKSLLKNGAKFAPDSCGRTPLHLAAAIGASDIIEVIANPKNVNEVDSVGRTALQIAATGGHIDAVSALLSRGANPNTRDKLHGNTPIHEASWHGFSQTVALIVKSGAESGIKNLAGFAPLHLACQNGHNQSCRELLINGADPDIQNNYGDTALHTSARYGHAGVARILISACCRVSDQNKNGDTALHIAAAMGRRKLTTILLEAGCDKTIRNKQYETACDIATRKDLNEIIIILQNVKPQKVVKKKSKASETSDSDRRSRETITTQPHDPRACGSSVRWSPYGCHYYPDPKAFPQPKLDSLPGEPLSKGEQYYLDLAGNICKGPVGVGLTCYCTNFLRDMEARLEKNNKDMKERIKAARSELEERVEKTEELIAEWLQEGHQKKKKKKKENKSQTVDLLENTPLEKRSSTVSPINSPRPPKEDMADVEKRLRELSMRAEEEEMKKKMEEGMTRLNVEMDKLAAASNGELTSLMGIEDLPYRSRIAVYSPSFAGLDEPIERTVSQSSFYVPENIKTINSVNEGHSSNLE